MKSSVPADIEKLKFKDAKGITERGKKDTNSMLAERDYSVPCDTTGDPLMVVHGVWIWFCKSHYQPLSHCEHAKTQERVLAFAEAVKLNDKTEPYEYGHYPHRERRKNAAGQYPEQFQRWLTPREMALNFIRDMKR